MISSCRRKKGPRWGKKPLKTRGEGIDLHGTRKTNWASILSSTTGGNLTSGTCHKKKENLTKGLLVTGGGGGRGSRKRAA